jgi:formylglycine-generating enzyme required for sulfatase activity
MRVVLLLSLLLILVAPAVRAEPGMISLVVQPADAEIWIDGQVRSFPPSMQKTMEPGLHEVAVYKKTFVTQGFKIKIAPGAVTTVEVALTPEGGPVNSPVPVFRDCQDRDEKGHFICPEMVVVPPGSYIMGSPEREVAHKWLEQLLYPVQLELPQHRVTIAYAFAVGRFAVTFDEWDACTAAGACPNQPQAMWGRGRQPVTINWNDTKKYLAWLSLKTGKNYRLLSEAEWEYAARAGTTTPFYTGETLTSTQANIKDLCTFHCDHNDEYTNPNGLLRSGTLEVGSFPPNGFGLYDMLGNVDQWVEDCWEHYDRGPPSDGRAWTPAVCKSRVVRGGSFLDAPQFTRSASRGTNPPDRAFSGIGFRVARPMDP